MVDLLPDRQAETLAGWLRRHPGVEVVARDRAGAYADGVRQGAPNAVQAADRWHLLRNLGDAVRAVVDRQHAAVRRVAKQVAEQRPMPTAAAPAPDNVKLTAAARRSQASFARRQARYEETARLHAAGVSISRIAAQLGADRKTIRVWLQAGGPSLWRKPPRVGVLAPTSAALNSAGRRVAATPPCCGANSSGLALPAGMAPCGAGQASGARPTRRSPPA